MRDRDREVEGVYDKPWPWKLEQLGEQSAELVREQAAREVGEAWSLEPDCLGWLERKYPDLSWGEVFVELLKELSAGSEYELDWQPEEVTRVMASFAMLVWAKAQWWLEEMDEDMESLLPQCLHTAMVWERG